MKTTPHPSPEWVEGAPLSTYLRLAVADARAALATGHYVLDGYVWHERSGGSLSCGICLAGGVLARRTGFDPDLELHLDSISTKSWEREALLALNHIRTGNLDSALRRLDALPMGFDALGEFSEELPSLSEVEDKGGRYPYMAPLDTYEQLAKELAAIDL